MTRIYLGGGGSEQDEGALWDEVFLPGRRVAVWPFAVPAGPARRGSVEWFTSALRDRGDITVEAWGVEESGDDVDRLDRTDVVAIPGGNTFDLLHQLRERRLLGALADFAARGGAVYGGSAGAILLGADIAIAEVEDANDAGVRDTRGLDLLAGAVVRPHYQPSQDEDLTTWSREHQQVVLAIPERAGVVVSGSSARSVGPEAVEVFTPDGRSSRPEGAEWGLGAV
ncbi:Type 1 glutamine amidotransferase-like domain-containing protein [Desertihabitans aurantiacus]|uniref:Type 1 glutamine amidotransferase-like domain-containing protein n=1 Tax=Desertihabitans aurantiacus TaxID=2282477 RepID=UPI0013008089|nr:Type 1 glutamine amidotransferase-like domain-containing protein [Desertihabitans aurantiacus]